MKKILAMFFLVVATGVSGEPKLQRQFDSVGPVMKTLESAATGRSIFYLDEGDEEWRPVLFIGGGGTSGRVFALMEFLRTTREELKLRFIAVERNGFGNTGFDDSLDYADYADDVEEVLDYLGVRDFSLFAISGGGPYSAAIAARNARRLESVHLASALTYFDPGSLECVVPAEALTFYTQNPMNWFGFPADSPVHRIPGFQDAAFDDAARTFNMSGQVGAPDALYHELQLYCLNQQLPDLSAVSAPVFLYYGEADETTPPSVHVNRWVQAFSNATVATRLYPEEGHDVQYRHFDQILVDMSGWAERTVVCDRGGKTRLVKEKKAQQVLSKGGSLGICAWRD
ncbi:MAG: alpha/beta hydrolase, partial [Halieaceae bacterium]|jgi:pimeloyl-ACP methyl ester carboxylesterase|nr:alpha/beta hydrolase [Halieaceae bacterium]